MTTRILVPALLLYFDSDGRMVQEETHAAPESMDGVEVAAERVSARKPVLVAHRDLDAVMREAREGVGE
jgi:hypothetical protein